MYPGTIFNWHDNSAIEIPTTSNVEDGTPLFMQVFSCDKGTEDFIEIGGDDFYAMYGKMDFFRHGQSAIQAKNIIDHGGKLYAKRVVAENSTLANAVLVATVAAGTGSAKVSVKWEVETITGKSSLAEVIKAAKETYSGDGKYPLIVYCDNGRGVSDKAVSLAADYTVSRTVGGTLYNLIVREKSSITEKRVVSFDPDFVYADESYKFDKYSAVQISGEVIEEEYEKYVADLASKLIGVDFDVTVDELKKCDLIFGYTNRGAYIPGWSTDPSSVAIDAEVGIPLQSGDNGDFGDGPMTDSTAFDSWTAALIEAFDNTKRDHDEVYDLDRHKIAAVIDANYPIEVKEAIFRFVEFREDCVFLRDLGTTGTEEDVDLETWTGIVGKYNEVVNYGEGKKLINRYTADYCTTYNIIDPTSKKSIKVTMLYDLAACLVDHIRSNAYAPVAGSVNNFILESAIKGTVNFTPSIVPIKVGGVWDVDNQKEAIDNLRINYAIFEDDNCVVQSCYTSQAEYTQLSYLGNVIGIQDVLRAVRTACPKNRFSLSTGADLSNYADAVSKVLENYMSNFSILNFIYVQDSLKAAQKIFYASIEFAFLNWAQTEIFDIYAINDF